MTYRLVDSLPHHVLKEFIRERDDLVIRRAQDPDGLTPDEKQRIAHLHAERIEAYLDAGNGSCGLRYPAVADCVLGNLRHFNGNRYQVHAWCIMPNHVHMLVEPLAGHQLRDIVHSWKSYTAKIANRLLNRTGEWWQAEYYDHLIRDEAEYLHAVRYIEQNTVKAGLSDWRWVSRGIDSPPVETGQA